MKVAEHLPVAWAIAPAIGNPCFKGMCFRGDAVGVHGLGAVKAPPKADTNFVIGTTEGDGATPTLGSATSVGKHSR